MGQPDDLHRLGVHSDGDDAVTGVIDDTLMESHTKLFLDIPGTRQLQAARFTSGTARADVTLLPFPGFVLLCSHDLATLSLQLRRLQLHGRSPVFILLLSFQR